MGKDNDAVTTFLGSWPARAQKDFSSAGYRESHRKVINGNHHSYDIPALLGPDLRDLDR